VTQDHIQGVKHTTRLMFWAESGKHWWVSEMVHVTTWFGSFVSVTMIQCVLWL